MPDYGAHDFMPVTGIAAATYPADPQYSWGFATTGIRLHNRVGAVAVYFSFDGINDHGKIAAAGIFENGPDFVVTYGRIWFRLESGGGPNSVDATVWG